MDSNGWYFPSSYEDYKKGGCLLGLEAELEDAKISADLLVNQPLEHDNIPLPEQEEKPPETKRKKKKKWKKYNETFFDKYDLTPDVLGRGAHSLVTVAIEKETGKEYAVKAIEKYDGYDRSRVLREIDLLHFLRDCPNVLHLHDAEEETDDFYLVFEKMEGGTLLHTIENKKYFTEREASLVVKEIAGALKFLHDKGISHRDLKPDNILCVSKDSIVPVVICDFNLASGISMIGSVTTPDLYTPVGSAEYMAPEVVDAFVGDAAVYDKRCDLWSLGVILYIMLSGKPPFTADCEEDCDWEIGGACRQCQRILWHNISDCNYSFPEETWSHVSLEAKDLISNLLVKEVSRRYAVDDVLCHPWLTVASNNQLNTPEVLSKKKETGTSHLSNVLSEAVAFRRLISERQRTSDERKDGVLDRWSTPPRLGLSPPGKSSLAKRRSLKNRERIAGLDSPSTPPGISPTTDLQRIITDATRTFHLSMNTTPTQSPTTDAGQPIPASSKTGFHLNLDSSILDSENLTPRNTDNPFLSDMMASTPTGDGFMYREVTPTQANRHQDQIEEMSGVEDGLSRSARKKLDLSDAV